MALVKCRECGANVSSGAESCPNCGVAIPAARFGDVLGGTVALLLLVGVVVVGVILFLRTEDAAPGVQTGERTGANGEAPLGTLEGASEVGRATGAMEGPGQQARREGRPEVREGLAQERPVEQRPLPRVPRGGVDGEEPIGAPLPRGVEVRMHNPAPRARPAEARPAEARPPASAEDVRPPASAEDVRPAADAIPRPEPESVPGLPPVPPPVP